MKIICPVDVKYRGELHKAHTQFNCDSSDFQKLLQPLGAWAFEEEKPAKKEKENKETK